MPRSEVAKKRFYILLILAIFLIDIFVFSLGIYETSLILFISMFLLRKRLALTSFSTGLFSVVSYAISAVLMVTRTEALAEKFSVWCLLFMILSVSLRVIELKVVNKNDEPA
ncbi:hypothetical protein KAZ57_00810 [Patescibacteria group bacterium]|nr:hypothetical protein [Patescibacteria group bacterium]